MINFELFCESNSTKADKLKQLFGSRLKELYQPAFEEFIKLSKWDDTYTYFITKAYEIMFNKELFKISDGWKKPNHIQITIYHNYMANPNLENIIREAMKMVEWNWQFEKQIDSEINFESINNVDEMYDKVFNTALKSGDKKEIIDLGMEYF